jgi:hypothetical protein
MAYLTPVYHLINTGDMTIASIPGSIVQRITLVGRACVVWTPGAVFLGAAQEMKTMKK